MPFQPTQADQPDLGGVLTCLGFKMSLWHFMAGAPFPPTPFRTSDLRIMDVGGFGSWMSETNFSFSEVSRAEPFFLNLDVRLNDLQGNRPQTSKRTALQAKTVEFFDMGSLQRNNEVNSNCECWGRIFCPLPPPPKKNNQIHRRYSLFQARN